MSTQAVLISAASGFLAAFIVVSFVPSNVQTESYTATVRPVATQVVTGSPSAPTRYSPVAMSAVSQATQDITVSENNTSRAAGALGALTFSLTAVAALVFAAVRRQSSPPLLTPLESVAIAAMSGRKDEDVSMDRRQALVGATALASLVASSPAHALFGFGEDDGKKYVEETQEMIAKIKAVLTLDASDPTKPDKVKVLRTEMNAWVAKYRRDTRFSGKASFGNLYSVINALAGHYTNFGAKTPIPKKRAAQIVTEIGQAEALVAKGR